MLETVQKIFDQVGHQTMSACIEIFFDKSCRRHVPRSKNLGGTQ